MHHPEPPNPKLWNTVLSGVIVTCASFLLGAHVVHWNIDYGLIWTQQVINQAIRNSLVYYSEIFYNAPSWYLSTLAGLCGLAILATVVKLVITGTSGLLFDGATLMLLSSAIAVYSTNVLAALPYLPLHAPKTATLDPTVTEALRSIAASHMIIAVSLTGVLSLQAAQSYSERKPAYDPVRGPAGNPASSVSVSATPVDVPSTPVFVQADGRERKPSATGSVTSTASSGVRKR
ncbi:hypothetical protein T439DRAFT_377256 [Meredithblackwellia eburnea MCA 4105]